ncbi:MAG: DUF2798 domain-containing protein [Pseudomonadota bacterium]
MSVFMSGATTAINLGIDAGFLWRWTTAWSIARPSAFGAI